MVYNFFFDKKTGMAGSVNEELAQELQKPVIKKPKRWKIYARVKDSIWVAELVEMGLLSFKNRGVKYLLCVIDVFTKYSWAKSLKDTKAKTVLHAFIDLISINANQINYAFVKGESFTIVLCKNC